MRENKREPVSETPALALEKKMSQYDFETIVKRRPANLKLSATDPAVLRAGNVSFDGAEPDFKSAPAIEHALKALAENGLYGFTLCDDVYREAVSSWMRRERTCVIDPQWIVPTLGTIHSVATAIRLFTKEGEGIILTPPVYNRYEQAADRLHRKTVKCPLILSADTDSSGERREGEIRYHMDFDTIEQAMRQKENKLFILCNPHNPIGQIWKKEELEQLAALAEACHVVVFSDEIFAETVYGGHETPCYLDIPGARSHCIVSTSLGKAFHFTGVNHANMLIPDEGIREAFIRQRNADHYGSIDPFAYESLLAAYSEEGRDWLHAMNRYVEENIRKIKAFFREVLPKAQVYGGEGGYILWIDFRPYFASEEEMVEFLYHKAYFHVDPGSSYGAERFARMCVASPWHAIEKALGDLKRAFVNSPSSPGLK